MGISLTNLKAFTRFEQSLFGLFFVLTAALLPFSDKEFVRSLDSNSLLRLFFILPTFLSARISGTAFNELIDKNIDALNPRTQHRPVAAKLIKPMEAAVIAFGALFSFLFFSFLISPLCFFVGLTTALLLGVYSFMKRIHYSCHFVLGVLYFLLPVSAYLAVRESIDLPPLILGIAAFFSITGNEIMYATQDFAFDKAHKLHSIPTYFGVEKSLLFAKIFHVFCVFFLILFGISSHFIWIFFLAPLSVSLIFVFFHRRWRKNPSLFFSCNVLVGFSIFAFTFLSVVWRAL